MSKKPFKLLPITLVPMILDRFVIFCQTAVLDLGDSFTFAWNHMNENNNNTNNNKNPYINFFERNRVKNEKNLLFSWTLRNWSGRPEKTGGGVKDGSGTWEHFVGNHHILRNFTSNIPFFLLWMEEEDEELTMDQGDLRCEDGEWSI